ncbi:DUF5606 family protein [Carboxylicivirga marina]|uniref:DUF5606 domain-containing protein n=1 Tax=Carboxylicivirga marina TaxID=2800988 RepID=A0ABS1HNU7_9BACT|nr:DUF5606 domain-containing protein [Carboxylicivirga marina]MBK3519357.1 DUF5606 domain-containing protein [Carboxylicivirga marina]
MLKGILAISGQRGLFKLVSQAKNSIIVESLIDGKRIPAYATSRISALEDISIYTEDEDVKLFDVFKAIYEKENGGMAIAPKSSGNELKAYFTEILPLYDKDRVYVSDIKKVLTWYNLLMENELFDPNATEEDEDEAESAE